MTAKPLTTPMKSETQTDGHTIDKMRDCPVMTTVEIVGDLAPGIRTP
jgi:hypothetical protein